MNLRKQEILKQKEDLDKQLEALDDPSPKMISDKQIDWSVLKELVSNIMEEFDQVNDTPHIPKYEEYRVYECVMKTLYGPDVFKWIDVRKK